MTVLAMAGPAVRSLASWFGVDRPKVDARRIRRAPTPASEARSRAAFRQLIFLLENDPTNTRTHEHLLELLDAEPDRYGPSTYDAALQHLESHPDNPQLVTFTLECGRICGALRAYGTDTSPRE